MSNTLDALTNGGRRVKTHDAHMVVKLPSAAKALIKRAAEAQQLSDSALVRQAIAEYLERRGYNR